MWLLLQLLLLLLLELSGVLSRLPERPKLADRFAVLAVGEDAYRLHSLTHSLSISGRTPNLLSSVLSLVDGEHSVEEIVRALSPFDEERVLAVLDELARSGVLEDAAQRDTRGLSEEELDRYRDQLTFFSLFSGSSRPEVTAEQAPLPLDAVDYQKKLKQASVVVYGLGRLGSQLVRSLTLAGVGRIVGVDDGHVTAQEAGSDAWFEAQHVGLPRGGALGELVGAANSSVDFAVVEDLPSPNDLADLVAESVFAVLCTDHFDVAQYDVFNRACLESETEWTSCRVAGFEFEIGPTVIPHQTPCYRCFDLRRKSNLTSYDEYATLEPHWPAISRSAGALAITPGIGLAALEAIKALTHFAEPATYAHLHTLNLLTLEARLHPILKIPRCTHCGRSSQPRPTIHVWEQTQMEAIGSQP